jgi:exosome complex exonuclease RRP6
VLKVLHGGDSDVAWLQRDYGLFLVNMFDTGQVGHAAACDQAVP